MVNADNIYSISIKRSTFSKIFNLQTNEEFKNYWVFLRPVMKVNGVVTKWGMEGDYEFNLIISDEQVKDILRTIIPGEIKVSLNVPRYTKFIVKDNSLGIPTNTEFTAEDPYSMTYRSSMSNTFNDCYEITQQALVFLISNDCIGHWVYPE